MIGAFSPGCVSLIYNVPWRVSPQPGSSWRVIYHGRLYHRAEELPSSSAAREADWNLEAGSDPPTIRRIPVEEYHIIMHLTILTDTIIYIIMYMYHDRKPNETQWKEDRIPCKEGLGPNAWWWWWWWCKIFDEVLPLRISDWLMRQWQQESPK